MREIDTFLVFFFLQVVRPSETDRNVSLIMQNLIRSCI